MSVDFNELKVAVQRRNQFLEEHPELQQFQDEINRVLARAGKDKHARNVALQTLLIKTWFKIIET